MVGYAIPISQLWIFSTRVRRIAASSACVYTPRASRQSSGFKGLSILYGCMVCFFPMSTILSLGLSTWYTMVVYPFSTWLSSSFFGPVLALRSI